VRFFKYKRFWRIARAALIGYLLVLAGMMFLEDSLIYHPSVYPHGDWQSPGFAFEDAWFTSADGTQLHGWYVPAENPRAVILFCHGNAGNITNWASRVGTLNYELGATVLIFDYRGFGRSQGKPNERGILADARAARAWLAERAGVAETDIVLMGDSLGGGVAVDLAAADGARGLVLQNTFSSLPDVAAHYFPWLPVRWLMRTRLDSINKIAQYHGPLLQSHGDADTTVPYPLACRLFEAANEPKQLITLPGRDHNDYLPPAFYETLKKFLAELGK
jgi:uncharacterized protein